MLNIQGAAIGTVMAFAVGSALNLYYLKRYTGIRYELGRLLKISLLTVLMGIGVYVSYGFIVGMGLHSHLSTLLAICIGVAIYGGLLLILKLIDMDMVKRLTR